MSQNEVSKNKFSVRKGKRNNQQNQNQQPTSISLSGRLSDIEQQRQRLLVEEGVLIEKALLSDNPDDIIKASATAKKFFQDISVGNSRQKSTFVNPFEGDVDNGYKEKPFNLSDTTLRRMSKAPIIRSIINTRTDQVADFSEPQPNKYTPGFVIKKRTKYGVPDNGKVDELSKEDIQKITYLTDFMINCGNTNHSWQGDDFDSFLRKLVQDSLAMDKYTFEIVEDRRGQPVEFIATDSATMKLVKNTKDNYLKRTQVKGYFPSVCQVMEEQIIADFYPWEMCMGIRNVTTDIKYNGYGMSELEDLISTVTSMLWSDEYNSRFFSQGSMPKGIISVSGGVSRQKLAEFRQEWLTMVSGVYNAHKTPILDAEKFNWVDLHKSNQDMEFSKWQEYLIKLSCAIFRIDPSEIGFNLQGSGSNAGMGGDNHESKINYSKNKGLKPLLKHIQNKINRLIIWRLDPEYEFQFVGINTESEQAEEDRLIKAGGLYLEINEIRKMKGLDTKPGYDMIANPIVQQAKTMAAMGGQDSNDEVDFQQEQLKKAVGDNPLALDFIDFINKEFKD